MKFIYLNKKKLTMVAERSEACTVFARSIAGIVGLNPIQGMDVCVCLFCVLCCSVFS
jgi:hypothetical protein